MLVENDLIHAFCKLKAHFREKGCGVRGGFASKSLGVLSKTEHPVDLIVIDFWNLMGGHILNVVVVSY